ncbi:DNA-binding transcriptional regulator LsrR, DeoR family [Beijerinckiaceae bacterium RH AL1]|nr:helix-turn-helix domain-containing protein [Beijerinckiaceae bacterium]VVB44398.1 DNA-binding transcriptional regulator LsrR, DeoR family [Beijerinckiaceae bacterium RH CH11]VVB44479.1 DNA-binding transcriptional regulator LsrR, DeoR family [Beijerinckiaceae bacterium RH AL8]VVC54334.1 DNA-binding transcriptional regulator LsrR, DeoR family [Beijerinckiaceae bacterium RH AL1]
MDIDHSRLDDAARAGWLYFVAGRTQDEIARQLGVSRATAQRLVALCRSEGLISFRLEHRISACMELARRLAAAFALRFCEVAPSDPAAPLSVAGIAERAGQLMEDTLRADTPAIIGLGTGRAVRAAVEHVVPMDRANHQLVSLVGNISADGSASRFDATARLADLTRARHYPMPLPFLAPSEAERARLQRIDPISRVRDLAATTDLRLVGIGQMDEEAQLLVDGFVTRHELIELIRLGAVGEVTGWAFDAKGRILKGGTNKRVTSVPHPPARKDALIVAAAIGPAKVAAIRAAVRGGLVNGLVTDEATATLLLTEGGLSAG